MKVTVPLLAVALLSLLLSRADAEKLSAFRTCTGLKQYYARAAILRVGPGGLTFPRDTEFTRHSFGIVPEKKVILPESDVDFSKTNVQVEGVDEPDVIKTDGKRVFTLRGRNLYVTSVSRSGASGTAKGSIKLPSNGNEILFKGDHILVLQNEFSTLVPKVKSTKYPLVRRGCITVLYQVSVKSNEPVLVATLRLEGHYFSAREVDGVVRIVSSFQPENHIEFQEPKGKITQQISTNLNKAILQNTTYKDWMPFYHMSSKKCGKKGCTGPLIGCSNVYHPGNSFGGFGMLSVTTVSITGSLTPRSVAAITGDGSTVYSTATSLYAATTDSETDFFGAEGKAQSGPLFKTSFHKFALSMNRASYVGSGEVSGSVLNQFSMHEYDGIFFVATTDGSPWWNNRDVSKSKVSSFAANMKKRQLKKIGEVGNLGIGERIFSVRYIKDTVYVVTFRKVDPLYIVDLSNPKKLKTTGELKIPGYSSYLHPIAPGRILGVGQDVKPNGQLVGAKVSLFDVSDKTAPKELATWSLKGSYSSAEWEHRAFLYWKPEKVAVLPVRVEGSGKNDFTGSIVLDVSDSAIKERGRLSHSGCCGNKNIPTIQRNLVLRKKFLWSLSSQQLQVNDIQDMSFKSKKIIKE